MEFLPVCYLQNLKIKTLKQLLCLTLSFHILWICDFCVEIIFSPPSTVVSSKNMPLRWSALQRCFFHLFHMDSCDNGKDWEVLLWCQHAGLQRYRKTFTFSWIQTFYLLPSKAPLLSILEAGPQGHFLVLQVETVYFVPSVFMDLRSEDRRAAGINWIKHAVLCAGRQKLTKIWEEMRCAPVQMSLDKCLLLL